MRLTDFWWRDRAGIVSAALQPIAAVWERAAVRRLAQPPAGRIPVPVVCVGNPTVGGAGKTPVAIGLAALASAGEKQPFFLTRGYKGRLKGPVVVEPGKHTSADVGDEALLLARHAPTVVAADRIAGAALAYQKGADVVVMDDGFQDPSLNKDFSLLVIDAEVGVGNRRVLPAGPLRAPLEAQWPLADVAVIVGRGEAGERLAAEAAQAGLSVWQAFLVGRAPHLVGRRVVAFAGIGRPQKFFTTLREIGADVVEARGFPDHHRFSEREAAALLDAAAAHQADLVTTEKDAARLVGLGGSAGRLRETALRVPAVIVFADRAAVERAMFEVLSRPRRVS